MTLKRQFTEQCVSHTKTCDLDLVVSEKPQQSPRWGWIAGNFPETKHFSHTKVCKRTMPGQRRISDFVTPEQPDLIMAAKYVHFTAPTKVTGLGPWVAELR